jgi:nuclear migration protein JNM1
MLTLPTAARTMYTYPPSPNDSDDDYPPAHAATLPFSARLRFLQQELVILEAEVAKSNVKTSEKEKKKDAGQMIDGLKDIKSRLEMIGKTRGKEGRERLVEAIQSSASRDGGLSHSRGPSLGGRKDEKEREREKEIAELDRRLGELERLVGSSSAALDEVSGFAQGGLRLLTYIYVVVSQSHHHYRHRYYQCLLDSTPS